MLLLGHDPARQTATFRIRIPFQLQTVKRQHSFLYVFIDPTDIKQLQRRPRDAELPDPVAQSLLGKRSAHGVVGLELQLSKPPTVVGPANITRLSPRGDVGGDALASLRLLARATRLTLYVPQTSRLRDGLPALCAAISAGNLGPDPKDHAMDMLYTGNGAKDIADLLAPLEFRRADPADSAAPPPPSYEEAIPAAGKRRALSGTPSPPPPKRTPVPDAKSQPSSAVPHAPSPWVPNSALEQLCLELNVLRQQVALRDSTPTEDGFLLDRLDGFEQRLIALEARVEEKPPVSVPADENLVAKLVEALVPQLLDRLQNRMDDCLGERLHGLLDARVDALFEDKQVDERFDELFRDMVDPRVDALFEEGVDGRIDKIEEDVFSFKDEVGFLVKDELAEAVEKHLPEVVADQLPDVVAETLSAADISVHVSRPG